MSFFPLPLEIPRNTLYERLEIRPDATAEEIRAAEVRLDAKLTESGADAQEIAEAHSIQLERPESRAAHDAAHPPLTLLQVVPCWPTWFDDRRELLSTIRRDVEEFLRYHGAPIHHPTDLTRTDFQDEFSYSPLLDGTPESPSGGPR